MARRITIAEWAETKQHRTESANETSSSLNGTEGEQKKERGEIERLQLIFSHLPTLAADSLFPWTHNRILPTFDAIFGTRKGVESCNSIYITVQLREFYCSSRSGQAEGFGSGLSLGKVGRHNTWECPLSFIRIYPLLFMLLVCNQYALTQSLTASAVTVGMPRESVHPTPLRSKYCIT